MKQAEHCGCGSMPTLNQTGELKDIFCMTSRCLSSASKRLRVGFAVEVALRPSPPADRAHDAAMSCFTLRSARSCRACAEVFRHDDVGAVCDQDFGTSTSFCSEDHLAALVADDRAADLPLDLVEGIDPDAGEVALQGEAVGGLSQRQGRREPGLRRRAFLRLRRRSGLAIPQLGLLFHSASPDPRGGVQPAPKP
jgi:hypothetical protein